MTSSQITLASGGKLHLAILDLNAGAQSRAVAAIRQLAGQIGYVVDDGDIYDIRGGAALPPLHKYRVFVSTGGPGDPNDKGQEENKWGAALLAFYDAVLHHNKGDANNPVYLFLICHSFQMATAHWQLGRAVKRDNGRLKGIHAQEVLPTASQVPNDFLPFLKTPLFTVESRDWRIDPAFDCRAETPLMSPVDAINFVPVTVRAEDAATTSLTCFASSDGYILATQFHPEISSDMLADMIDNDVEWRKIVTVSHGAEALEAMRAHLDDAEISHHILKSFLTDAYHARRYVADEVIV